MRGSEFSHVFVIHYHIEDFQLGTQQDAHEFFTFLIDAMDNELKALSKEWEDHDRILQEERERIKKADEAWEKYVPRKLKKPGRTWLSRLVEGRLSFETTCHECDRENNVVEPFLTISVDIFDGCHVAECLERYCEREILSGSNQYFCENCGHHTNATRRTVFDQLPPIFVVHLKRFTYLDSRETCEINKYFDNFCRVQYLVISDRSIELKSKAQDSAVAYDLFAVVSHVGTSPNYGHYVATTEVDGHWYRCDDDTATMVCNVSAELGDEYTYGNPDSYILFYRMTSIMRL
ncbi:Ubiquitin carboxyl-terminal hydrolase 3 [Babesia sp. Xinjiang]|uniref:Ubiquitin carboxyl-terminal hydrolase 3 n=1 Tax=Babesia sp. Xinjiang TaxID=462227 RepID=UPI000A227022|nr:Ubiquitin carboxyl-terminal hydrolase 3 [Babesia sp. Xinjiang]ORM41792.1 Ubiquitin carboxyl-terminal hydrolase 3 [Babesia sp. Xinjiang]